MHIYTHGYTHICTSSCSGSSRRHLTRYAELLPESMLVSLSTSVTAFLLPQVTLPRGQKWAKDGNLIPSQKTSAPTSAASVIHSSCDTAAMCWGAFFTQWESGTWVQQDLTGICVDDELERAEDLLGKWKVFVCDQIKILVKRKDCWTLGFTTKEQKICTYIHVHTKQEKHWVKQHTLKGLLSLQLHITKDRGTDWLIALLSMCEHLRQA